MKIERIIKIVDSVINTVETSLNTDCYSINLLHFIKTTENRSKRLLLGGRIIIKPNVSEKEAERMLYLISRMEYVIKIFPSYYEEAKSGLELHKYKKTTTENYKENYKETLLFITEILPQVNKYITENSTIEDWKGILENKEPTRIIKTICKNKLLGEFIAELKRKRQLSNTDNDFGKYFGTKTRFIEVATRTPKTEKDKKILAEIFATVQK